MNSVSYGLRAFADQPTFTIELNSKSIALSWINASPTLLAPMRIMVDNRMADNRTDPTGLDAYKPAEIAQLIEDAGVKKAELATVPLATLAFLAGTFIALGAAAFTAAMTGGEGNSGPARLLGSTAGVA